MALRLTLWALLLGTLVLGYFGLQVGSATTTLVGALVLAFILFLLYFFAKNLVGIGAVLFKIILITALIVLLGIGLMKGCSILTGKTISLSKSISSSVSQTVQETKSSWYDNGTVGGSFTSVWDWIKNTLFGGMEKTTIPPSASLPSNLVDGQGNISEAILLEGVVEEIRTGYLFRIKNHFIKLYAIDAPDPKQTCLDRQGAVYPCGQLAKNKLKKLIMNKKLKCSLVATDGMDNYVATCKMGEYDIGAVMVSSGWAVANRASTNVYVPYEHEARQHKKGLWEGKFVAPWKFRQ